MGATVTIHLVGRLKKDWKTIQDTYADGEPLVVPAPQLLPGLADGLTGMKVGGVRRLTIPPDRGFKNREPKNEKGEVVIPAGSTLVYDVELVAAKQSFAAPKPPPDPVPAPTTPDMNK
jgi:FKBP-type peptidyl-prolyl cis-trans isomerase